MSARLLALEPGGVVEEHKDEFIGFDFGQIRLHVPITVDPCASITIGGQTYVWDAGHLWYGDFSLSHSLHHRGSKLRTHLVMDVLIDDRVYDFFPQEYLACQEPFGVLVNREAIDDSEPIVLTPIRFEAPMYVLGPIADPSRLHETADLAIDRWEGLLTLFLSGVPTAVLEHLGDAEFRLRGWGDERTVRLSASGNEVQIIVRRGEKSRTFKYPML